MNDYAAKLNSREERERFVKGTIQIFEDQLLRYWKPSSERFRD